VSAAPALNESVVVARRIEAPRAAVFAAWTTAESMSAWYGPECFAVHSCSVDFRVGGSFRLAMRSPEGQDYWAQGDYEVIDAPERLVYISSALDGEMKPLFEVQFDLTFTETDGATDLRLTATVVAMHHESAPLYLGQMEEGLRQVFRNLAEHVDASR